jgi:monoamine oxidase
MLANLPINGTPVPSIAYGPAVKYLAPTDGRFWLPQLKAPLGFSDQIGMTWEGTDNQIGSGQMELSVFAGGQVAANALNASDADAFFQNGLQQLFGANAYVNPEFVRWPTMTYIGMGYSCPGIREVTTKQRQFSSPIGGRIYFAGEYVSPAWFGFMEGALQTGVAAAQRLIAAV